MVTFDKTALEVLIAMGYTCFIAGSKEPIPENDYALIQLTLKPFHSEVEAEIYLYKNPMPGCYVQSIDEDTEELARGVMGVRAVVEM